MSRVSSASLTVGQMLEKNAPLKPLIDFKEVRKNYVVGNNGGITEVKNIMECSSSRVNIEPSEPSISVPERSSRFITLV